MNKYFRTLWKKMYGSASGLKNIHTNTNINQHKWENKETHFKCIDCGETTDHIKTEKAYIFPTSKEDPVKTGDVQLT